MGNLIQYLKYIKILNILCFIILWTISTFPTTFGKEFNASTKAGEAEVESISGKFAVLLPSYTDCDTSWKDCHSYYTGESQKFRCKFPKTLYEKGIAFRFYTNETGWTGIDAEIDNSPISSNDEFYEKISQIKFTRKDITKLFCLARRKDSHESDIVFYNITVKVGIPAKVIKSSENMTVTSESTTLFCTAEGYPTPLIEWKMDGNYITATSNADSENGTRTSTISENIKLNSVSKFSCTASNDISSDTRNLTVLRVEVPKSRWVSVILILTGVIIASTSIFGKQYIRQFQDYIKGISSEAIKITRRIEIGNGNFGETELAEMRVRGKYRKVVVKKLKHPKNPEHQRCWYIELYIHQKLHKYRNDPGMNYIVEYIGYLWDKRGKEYYKIIFEYCEKKDLHAFLKQNKPLPPPLPGYEDRKPEVEITLKKPEVEITLKMQIQWCYEVSCAMEFLAKNRIMHGDLAARNVLLKHCDGNDSKLVAKVTDFGLSKKLVRNEFGDYDYISENGNRIIPVAHSSIEVLESEEGQGGKFTEFSDVWAFGVFMYEVFTFGDQPYAQYFETLPKNVKQQEGLKKFLKEGKRLEQPSAAPDSIHEIMKRCWNETPSERGTFSQLKNNLKEILRDQFGLFASDSKPEEVINIQQQ